jgi:hypothetical protein
MTRSPTSGWSGCPWRRTSRGGRYLFRLSHELGVSGPFGYTVRVVPHHAMMADYTELGLVANA